MGGHDRDGRRDEGELDIGAALGRLGARFESAMDRVADAVDRGVEGIERKVEAAFERAPGAEHPHARHDEAPAEGVGADAGASTADDGEPGPRKGFGKRMADGYSGIVEKARSGVTGAVSRGTGALDGAAGDAPWRMAGLDERNTRIAREVMRDVVPKVAGDRVASVLDGAAMKGGVAGAGLLLRVPLKGFAVPFLLGITAVETVRAVREVRQSVANVAARVDNEARSEEAYRSESAGA